MDYINLPKIELHLHLDCSLSYEVVHRLDPAMDEQTYRHTFIAPPKCLNLADFLTRAGQGIRLMQSREQLHLVTRDLFRQLRADNVIYAEIRFAPLLHTQGGLTAGKVVETIHNALEEGIAETGVEARLILCTLRHYRQAQSMETVQLVESFQGSKVSGFDIASDEANYPIDEHIRAFYYARDHGIPRTAHAGEARGPQSIWETLEHFAPSRLGHGVRSIEDPELVAHLAEHKIHLEVCPTSNIQTNVYGEMKDHPVDLFRRAGLSIGINTDARTIADVKLADEYQKLADTFQWKKEQFLQANLDALKVAFLDEEVKKKLKQKLEKNY